VKDSRDCVQSFLGFPLVGACLLWYLFWSIIAGGNRLRAAPGNAKAVSQSGIWNVRKGAMPPVFL
jgi:hypothetical protein